MIKYLSLFVISAGFWLIMTSSSKAPNSTCSDSPENNCAATYKVTYTETRWGWFGQPMLGGDVEIDCEEGGEFQCPLFTPCMPIEN